MEAFTFEPRKEKKKEFDVIPVYCAILGAVILGLLGYVIFKQYTRLKNRKIHKGHPHDDVEYSKASGGDSGVFVENDFYKQCEFFLNECETERKVGLSTVFQRGLGEYA